MSVYPVKDRVYVCIVVLETKEKREGPKGLGNSQGKGEVEPSSGYSGFEALWC